MCRLFGMIGKSPLPAKDALDAFYPLCTNGIVEKGGKPGHLDGWGASGFKDGRAVYFARSAESVDETKAAYEEVTERVRKSASPILMAHFRKTTAAPPAISNTHPFHWRDWVFAHDGTIFGAASSLPLNETSPYGETDSERFFLWLWEQVHATADPTATMIALLRKMRGTLVFSSLTFLMSDGQTLWAYRDFGDKRLNKGETIADRDNVFTLYTAEVGSCGVVCSEPLESLSKKWIPVAQRNLVVFTAASTSPQTFIV